MSLVSYDLNSDSSDSENEQKRPKKRIKISIPPLTKGDSDEEEEAKRAKPGNKLLEVLPAPKHCVEDKFKKISATSTSGRNYFKNRPSVVFKDLSVKSVAETTAAINPALIKSLTDPASAPKEVVENPVNETCKKKHHITYLAQQAKLKEVELQNEWALNKYARQTTRKKYGF